MNSKSHICLACPRSCSLRPQIEGLPGQRLCPQGEDFLLQEMKEPKRHYFATVRQDDGKLYAYRTLSLIPLSEIEQFCRKLEKAADAQIRNQLHREFCRTYQVRLACIDLAD